MSRTSPLHDRHVDAGARIVPFGGWDMPLEYAGTLEEHRACRTAAAVFDVSHLGTVRLTGAAAHDVLQTTLTNDLDKITAGRAQYTHLLDDDGSVLDDIIVWWYRRDGVDVFDVMPNASNTSRVIEAIGGTDVTAERAVLAVQGPTAREVVARLSSEAAAVRRFHVVEVDVAGVPVVVAGTGYTGEDGVELAVPSAAAGPIWDQLLTAGAVPAGLGARDTLRLEAGLPLHGHELGPGITPLQAGLGWVVAFGKPSFRGREALVAERERGVARLLRGIATEGRRPPRAECTVTDASGAAIGVTTSGNFSPVLGHGIALALLPPEVAEGAAVAVDVRGTALPGTVVPTPFVRSR
ncbi:MAG: glycine cleavage system aminomethyltransferase GcvT [Ilumatobacteraceae bacterium]|jgi:aminomethyltransferase|nr:glycine cleavage system aminomethyltransferase GcvT [Ilumatobacteraceae bacterium]